MALVSRFRTDSCFRRVMSKWFPATLGVDIAVRNDINPAHACLEQINVDSVQRVSISQIDISRPSHPVVVNSA
ncbi:hypothetical protein K438DRAFT_1972068 [Mycena galopus ATCC 62051]|nr:hypothetical protein K438DRAFT_1972068 [Mycena galopus ATCC 62051]